MPSKSAVKVSGGFGIHFGGTPLAASLMPSKSAVKVSGGFGISFWQPSWRNHWS
jgi:hypothetical protein